MDLDAWKETVRDIIILIDFVHVWCVLLTETKQNSRTKSGQHLAVNIISKVWHDLVVAELRLKKNFVEFAYLCLATARAGVTRNSIVESWDRHVLPGLIEEETTEEEAGT